ncbi:uncharacterized protein BO97DRAFT_337990 [Aspergillus homomorphus CBS 101889]|uniref:Transcription factor domain-containing protein n=1 Tax=Aspergillus homomorphus (strain CBS 101889) TaxID=1450537 RepID=A0A395I5U8_ASPHC|nr:hypothetical protein BO97DRAFT_337990 [Aspergillus homomorphus CBS 101889]RAL15377.1 hypothetical protein BO97DRAFT_337990 [Aspergillus homomorphus CBS 101889]
MTLGSPNVDHVIGWLLRVLYLRFTGTPNATWMASCTLMHLIETVNLHQVSRLSGSLANESIHLKQHLCCVARPFHMWISYDCGRSRVESRGTRELSLNEAWTPDELAIWHNSNSLDPTRHLEPTGLEALLLHTAELQLVHSALRLKRCNTDLCIYRRLRVSGRMVSRDVSDQLLRLVDEGSEIALDLATRRSPWWHIVKAPFQAFCVLLAIDSRASLEWVPKVLRVLQSIAETYKTDAINETLANAYTLLRIQHQRKKEDYDHLSH